MVAKKKSAYPVRGYLVERIRERRGMTLEDVALGAGISVKNLQRILGVQPAYLETIKLIADAIGIQPVLLRADLITHESLTEIKYKLSFTISGKINNDEQLPILYKIRQDMVTILNAAGIDVTGHSGDLNIWHTYMLAEKLSYHWLFGYTQDKKPFWTIVYISQGNETLFAETFAFDYLEIGDIYKFGGMKFMGLGYHPDKPTAQGIAELMNREPEDVFSRIKADSDAFFKGSFDFRLGKLIESLKHLKDTIVEPFLVALNQLFADLITPPLTAETLQTAKESLKTAIETKFADAKDKWSAFAKAMADLGNSYVIDEERDYLKNTLFSHLQTSSPYPPKEYSDRVYEDE